MKISQHTTKKFVIYLVFFFSDLAPFRKISCNTTKHILLIHNFYTFLERHDSFLKMAGLLSSMLKSIHLSQAVSSLHAALPSLAGLSQVHLMGHFHESCPFFRLLYRLPRGMGFICGLESLRCIFGI